MAGPMNPGRQLANSIIGKDTSAKTPPAPDNLDTPKPGTKHGFRRIEISPQADGSLKMEHHAPRKPGKEPDYDNYNSDMTTSVHATPEAAHAHLGKLLGIKGPGHSAPPRGR